MTKLINRYEVKVVAICDRDKTVPVDVIALNGKTIRKALSDWWYDSFEEHVEEYRIGGIFEICGYTYQVYTITHLAKNTNIKMDG